MTEREAYIAFSAFPGIGPLRFKLLCEYFGSAVSAWQAPQNLLSRIGLGDRLTQKLVDFRGHFRAGEYEARLRAREIAILTRLDPGFPQRLREIPDPPIALYVKGTLVPEVDRILGVVGTRKPTTYGKETTETLTAELVAEGFTIVSGMARGIDGIAHRAALLGDGQTIAVLGCGVDIIYPPEHRALYGDIIGKGGSVVSEVPPGHTVLKGLFPARNRLISGLSLGVLVTEGAQDSGSLITARLALEQGREVFAVPGPITSYLSAGPTQLIKQGAKLVTTVTDILEELNLHHSPRRQKSGQNQIPNTRNHFSEAEQCILSLLSTNGEMHYDDLVRQSGLSAAKVGEVLTQFELDGIIRALGNGKYGLN